MASGLMRINQAVALGRRRARHRGRGRGDRRGRQGRRVGRVGVRPDRQPLLVGLPVPARGAGGDVGERPERDDVVVVRGHRGPAARRSRAGTASRGAGRSRAGPTTAPGPCSASCCRPRAPTSRRRWCGASSRGRTTGSTTTGGPWACGAPARTPSSSTTPSSPTTGASTPGRSTAGTAPGTCVQPGAALPPPVRSRARVLPLGSCARRRGADLRRLGALHRPQAPGVHRRRSREAGADAHPGG